MRDLLYFIRGLSTTMSVPANARLMCGGHCASRWPSRLIGGRPPVPTVIHVHVPREAEKNAAPRSQPAGLVLTKNVPKGEVRA